MVAFSNEYICFVEHTQLKHTHFHPSGNLQPSKEAISVTDRMIKLTGLVGITLLDHIIIGGNNIEYFSMREKKLMRHERECYEQDYNNLKFEGSVMVAEKERSR